ncbi:hypothetical protein NQ317_004098 [Molorchus minor]|uniref:Helitron helicase-like domain-containing protein n=1 Tax=Molorchus minor TaxID=1323400 RepID=A0ABQ9JUN2_9CUCU|nr:hypothetical protein NQ317_004098 [Molorchus minor]
MEVFGTVKANLAVIEFQKKRRVADPIEIDTIICAEIPDRETEPELYEIVTKNMIHGPCGNFNPDSPCCENDMPLVRAVVNDRNQVNYDEIETFLNARYMAPPEAAWHILQFPLHKNTHTVYRLSVHLPQRQIVRFLPGFEQQALDIHETTQLTAWFQLNQNDIQARQYLYTEIPLHYIWKNAERRWTQRRRGADKIVVRLHAVNYRNQELYRLRLLLLHVRGALNYENIKTVDGHVCESFAEACR